MSRDRVYINSKYRSEIEEMKELDILGFKMLETKDIFLLTVAMGLNSPEPIKNKDGLFLWKNIKTSYKSMCASVLLGTAETDTEVDTFADIDRALDLCEQCAESGFKSLRKMILESSFDNELLQKRLMKELDLLYTSLVEDNISTQ